MLSTVVSTVCLSCVDPRSHARIWREGTHEGAIMASVHSLTQDSRNDLNRSRTRRNPFFNLFVQISGRI